MIERKENKQASSAHSFTKKLDCYSKQGSILPAENVLNLRVPACKNQTNS